VGGNVKIFESEAKTKKEVQKMQNEWAKTISGNLSGFNHQLTPIYKLIKHFNPQFASDMQTALEKQGEAILGKKAKFAEDLKVMNDHFKEVLDPINNRLKLQQE